MTKIEMLFYKTDPSETNTGMKYVLFEVTTDESQIIHEWGFADWLGKEWGEVPAPEGFSTKVVRWANTGDPALLLEEKRIVLLNGK
jgi:hypothetical protein